MSYTSSMSPTPASRATRTPSFSSLRIDGVPGSSDDDVYLFEVCWEVSRKAGGVYTVVRSKTAVTCAEFGDRYALVAPYSDHLNASTEFELLEPKLQLHKDAIAAAKQKYGIVVRFGRWLVQGYPRVLLLDLEAARDKLNEWRHDLSPNALRSDDGEVNDAIIFGYLTALVLKEYVELAEKDSLRMVAQFHEWMSAVACIVLRRWDIRIATIFTTHATLLGRYLSAARLDFYNAIESFDVNREAGQRGIYSRHWIEAGAANCATVFTTVSEITAYEAERFLGRKPQVLVPNGLQVQKFTALHEFQNLHAQSKEVINEFVRGHFYGHYDFDLDNTLYFFTSGRLEVYNKGIDMYIDALARLNHRLKQEGSTLTIIAFIITNTPTSNYNVESLKGQSVIKDLRKTCNKIVEKMSEHIFESTAKGELINPEELLSKEDLVRLKGRIFSMKQRNTLPPIVTHNLIDENDEVITLLRRHHLFNDRSDRVKVVYHPQFLSELSPLLPLDYNQFVRGCHLGVFPSYYEPWGYTPAECTVMGVPSITTNLTGFANFMARRIDDMENHGLYVVDRRYRSFDDAVGQTTNMMWRFTQLTRRGRIELRNRVEKLGDMLDWSRLGTHYQSARQLALSDVFPKKGSSGSHAVSADL
eukprot:TRINITY_DN12602_c0_g1_i1.p1 TRINITY_DN12602_c0_g1~~TRINITY_DN12602_c0_g1_i1.p1  ORF type:complete len:643 (-),score=208.63 TRINITY_DN12602_c0_g1_i1:371-2299(-)